MSEKRTIVLSGMVAGVPFQGGAAWAVLQYVLGFKRLGYEVCLIEPVEAASLRPAGSSLAESVNAAYFRTVAAAFGLEGRAALLLAGTEQTVGVPYRTVREAAARAELLLNISGMLTDAALTDPIPVRVYLDLDPAFNQLWAEQGIDMRFEGHTHFVTVGLAIGRPECPVPTGGRQWLTTVQPVVLERWPVADGLVHDALTTVGHWRGYGSIEHTGVFYGQKAHALRPLITLPRRTVERFVLALAIHPGETKDLAALAANSWQLVDPARVADTPARYQAFIQGSKAEFGLAKHGYVAARCGWFSDRSVCYLASGRPVIAQDTGFSRFLPTGEGLLAFDTLEEAVERIEAVRRDYPRHRRAARALAEGYCDSDQVLTRLLKQLGVDLNVGATA